MGITNDLENLKKELGGVVEKLSDNRSMIRYSIDNHYKKILNKIPVGDNETRENLIYLYENILKETVETTELLEVKLKKL
jgi:hypothetical protein